MDETMKACGARRSYSNADVCEALSFIRKMNRMSARSLARTIEVCGLRNVSSRVTPAVLRAMADKKVDVSCLMAHERMRRELGSGIRESMVGREVISEVDVGNSCRGCSGWQALSG